MKVQITKESKKHLTVAEMPAARKIIADFKDDYQTAADVAKDAAALVFGPLGNIKIYEATAEIAHNDRVFNYYDDDSGHLDIWVQFTAFNDCYSFLIGGIYISDLWSVNDENREEIIDRMYAKEYKAK